jgi:hypothetical protein
MQVFRYAHLVVLIALLAMSQAAFGHGFGLSQNGDTIAAESEVPTISPHLFVEVLDAFNSTTMFTDHGGVEADAGSGFNVPPDTLSVEFLGPLWYSSGGAAQRAPAGMTLNATSYDSFGAVMGSPANLTGSSNNPGSFPVVGNDDHSIGWILSGSSIPSGAYGFGYRVTGLIGGNPLTPFEPSVPLVVVFSTPDFTGGSLGNAQAAIFNAVLQGDFNQDGKTTTADINVMLQALTDLHAYQTARDLPDADLLAIGDLDRSGSITNADIQALLDLVATDSQLLAVPEPTGFLLSCMGFVVLVFPRTRP